MTFLLVEDQDLVPVDQALTALCQAHSMPFLGGASGKGWSSAKTLQICPRKHFHATRKSLPIFRDKEALDVGTLVHFFLALHYGHMAGVIPGYPTPDSAHESLMASGIDVAILEESWRVYYGYTCYYHQDWITPLVVEHRAESADLDYSCRYDLIARVSDDNDIGIRGGIYNIDHKTTGSFNQVNMEGWIHDGELRGQMLLYRELGLENQFGRLQGTIVNLIGRQKDQKFHRVPVPCQDEDLDAFRNSLTFWRELIPIFEQKGWPKNEASCVAHFGICEYYSNCW